MTPATAPPATERCADWKALVPQARYSAVEKALATAFGTTRIEDITPLTGGGSTAVVLRIVVDDRPYVLRVIIHVHALGDPARQFACLDTAARAGIAPRLYYKNAEDAVSITDFIHDVPLTRYKGALLVGLADTIRALQATPVFPAFVPYLDGIDTFIQEFRDRNLLPEAATRDLFRYYARIQQAYPRHDPDLVSSHNDLNPRNILFDGSRLWVIDWETAFANDRYADLANVANFFFRNELDGGEAGEEEETLLRAFFGDTLDPYKRARFFLMRQVCHMFYAMVLALSANRQGTGKTIWNPEMETPRLRDFHRRFAPGASEEDPLASPEGLFLYAKVRMNEALHNMKTPRFDESIRRMSPESDRDSGPVCPSKIGMGGQCGQ